MKMSRREDAILSLTSENLFLSEEGAELKFQEMEDGKFREMVIGNGRTRGVIFNRVDYGDTRKPENSSSEE